jgi:hypothetical protein
MKKNVSVPDVAKRNGTRPVRALQQTTKASVILWSASSSQQGIARRSISNSLGATRPCSAINPFFSLVLKE